MPLNVTLKPAVFETDETFLHNLFRNAHPEFQQMPLPQAEIDSIVSMQFHLQQQGYDSQFPQSRHDLILLDEEPVGRIWVNRAEEDMTVVDIAVLAQHRNRGIGATLYSRVMEEAREARLPVRCSVERFNAGSFRFHDRLGFRVYEETETMQFMEWVPPGAEEFAMLRPGFYAFARFREEAVEDPLLLAQLRETTDLASLTSLAMRLGRERGFEFDKRDIRRAQSESYKRWFERWVDA
ncbi:MAG: GNAT family N-acetyltransferase [Bryobacteraceae bacterium]